MNIDVSPVDTPSEPEYPAGDMPESPDVYTVEQVAERLQTTTRTVLRMIDRGELYAVRVGRLVRIPIAAYEALLRNEPYTPSGAQPSGDDTGSE